MNEIFFVDRVNMVLFCKTCIPVPENAILGEKQGVTPGVFSLEDIEYEKEKVQSRNLRRLKERLIKHLKTQTHEKYDAKQNEEARIKTQAVIRKIGSIAYFFFTTNFLICCSRSSFQFYC